MTEDAGAADQQAKWLVRLQRSRIGLSVSALALIVVGFASFTDALDKLLVWLRIEPNALMLAEESARGNFSRDFAREAWHRLFLFRRLVVATRAGFPKDDTDKIWDTYLKALDHWNSDLMINILNIEQYYGHDKRLTFVNIIQPQFVKIHFCFEALHYKNAPITCLLSPVNDIDAIDKEINLLNNNLFCFVSGFDVGGEKCEVKPDA